MVIRILFHLSVILIAKPNLTHNIIILIYDLQHFTRIHTDCRDINRHFNVEIYFYTFLFNKCYCSS